MVRVLLSSLLILLLYNAVASTGDLPATKEKEPPAAKSTQPAAAIDPVAATENKVEGLELPTDADVPYDEGYVVVQAKCKGPVKWLVVGTAKLKYHQDNNDLIVSIPPAGGTINIYAIGLVDNKQTDFARTILTIVPDPNIKPGPGPVDPPKPAKVLPKGTKLLIVAVLDFDNVTAEMAKALNDTDMRKQFEKDGHDFNIFDTKGTEAKEKNLLKAYNDNGKVPTIILMTTDGKVQKIITLPKTSAEITAAINKLLGG